MKFLNCIKHQIGKVSEYKDSVAMPKNDPLCDGV